jgi:uncharacterized membrane protein YhaH (DUF805 family)
MLKGFQKLFLSFRGRIPRSTFCWAGLATGFVFLILFVFLETMLGRATTWMLYPPFFWAMAALLTKRLHDRAKSPAWLLILLIPILGAVWLGIDLALRRGTPGENQYGQDPLDFGADYLTVA